MVFDYAAGAEGWKNQRRGRGSLRGGAEAEKRRGKAGEEFARMAVHAHQCSIRTKGMNNVLSAFMRRQFNREPFNQ